MRVLLAALAAALALPAQALAADEADAMAGVWSLTGLTEGAAVCIFTLGADETIGGWTIQFSDRCKRDFKLVADVAAWRVDPADGSIVFADATRREVARFGRTEDGAYVSPEDGGAGLVIQRGDPTTARPPSPKEAMTGVWKLSGLGGRPLCTFDLTSDDKGRSGTLKYREDCSSEWRTKGWAKWTLRGKELTLWDARGQPLIAFKAGDNPFTFHKSEQVNQWMGRGEMMFFGKVFD